MHGRRQSEQAMTDLEDWLIWRLRMPVLSVFVIVPESLRRPRYRRKGLSSPLGYYVQQSYQPSSEGLPARHRQN